jgi:hypothetical protein
MNIFPVSWSVTVWCNWIYFYGFGSCRKQRSHSSALSNRDTAMSMRCRSSHWRHTWSMWNPYNQVLQVAVQFLLYHIHYVLHAVFHLQASAMPGKHLFTIMCLLRPHLKLYVKLQNNFTSIAAHFDCTVSSSYAHKSSTMSTPLLCSVSIMCRHHSITATHGQYV